MITFEEFEDQWLQEIRADNPSTTQLGNRFAQKILRDWHEIDEATAEIILCDGAGDGGIDAAVFEGGLGRGYRRLDLDPRPKQIWNGPERPEHDNA